MRPGPLACAVALLGALWLGPLRAGAAHSFAAHMAMHTLVVACAAPLLVLAVAGKRHDPVRRLPRLFAPVPWAMFEFVVVWGWHTPPLHHLARATGPGLVAEQASFLLAASLVWASALGGAARLGGNRAAAGVLALLLTFMHMVLLGVLLAVAPRAALVHGAAPPGFDALGDQHLGGVVMIVGSFTYLAGGLHLAAALLRRRGAGAQERSG